MYYLLSLLDVRYKMRASINVLDEALAGCIPTPVGSALTEDGFQVSQQGLLVFRIGNFPGKLTGLHQAEVAQCAVSGGRGVRKCLEGIPH